MEGCRRVETLTGDVVDRRNPAYGAARMDSNRRVERFPRWIDFCASVHDVQNAVRWCRERRVEQRSRSGRHSYEGYSVLDGGVVIDVSAMNAVELDAARGTARVGAGANLGQIYDALWDQGRVTIPGGGCTGVGIAGLTLGGGFGFLTRLFGLTCDSMVSLEMVDAAGGVLTADACRDEDLFWASRGGGGGNFGIVTSFTFRVQPIANVTVFSIVWPWDAIRQVFGEWQRWADPHTLDQRLTPILILPARAAGYINVIGEFVGPLVEADRLIQPLLRAARPTDLAIVYEPYIDAVHRFVGAAPGASGTPGVAGPHRWSADRAADPALDRFKNTSAFQFVPLDACAVETMIAHLERSPSPNTEVQFNLHGGAEARLPPHATAYPWRHARCSMQYQAYWSDPAEGPALIAWVEEFRRALLPWTRGAYVNYIDADIADWPRAFYDDHLPRLLAIKRRYDPNNVFDFPQGLGRVDATFPW